MPIDKKPVTRSHRQATDPFDYLPAIRELVEAEPITVHSGDMKQEISPNTNSPVALLTGASGGIGECLAGTLDNLGYRCALVARSQDKLESIKSRLGEQHEVFVCDLADLAAAARLVTEVIEQMGRLDVLINNAGVGGGGAVHKADPQTAHRAMHINLLAPMQLTHDAAPHLCKSDQGTVINVVSISGQQASPGSGAYAASKHGLLGWSHASFEDLRDHGVKVCAICPGFVNTPMTSQAKADHDLMLQPADVAFTVKYVLESAATACPVEITLRPQRNPKSA